MSLNLCPECSCVLPRESSLCFNCSNAFPELAVPAPYCSPIPVRQVGTKFEIGGAIMGALGLFALFVTAQDGMGTTLLVAGITTYFFGRNKSAL